MTTAYPYCMNVQVGRLVDFCFQAMCMAHPYAVFLKITAIVFGARIHSCHLLPKLV